MKLIIKRLRPQTVAEYLCYRFYIKPGRELCEILGSPDAGCNYIALLSWVRQNVKRENTPDPNVELARMEEKLATLMYDAEIVDGVLEVAEGPIPHDLARSLVEEYVPINAPSYHAKSSIKEDESTMPGNVIKFPGSRNK